MIGLIGVCAALAGIRVAMVHPSPELVESDLLQVLTAARMWLGGRDPYALIGPGLEYDPGVRLYYPFTAVLAALPLAFLPSYWPEVLFVAFGTALFLWAISSDPRLRFAWVAIFSAPFIIAIQMPQWSPLLTGAALLPSAGFLLACKPTIGAALWLAYPSRRALIGGIVFLILSLALFPTWPISWLGAVGTATHLRAPITYVGGPLLLLAWLKWRRPEARLLGALALIPQTLTAYEVVPLFLIPRTPLSASVLWLSTWTGFMLYAQTTWGNAPGDYEVWMARAGQWMVFLAYLPCLIMVLMRPNTAEPPHRT